MPIYNFNAGPSALPYPVIEEAKKSMFDYQNSELSVLEMSHRGPIYEEIHYGALNKVRSLLKVPDEFEILFLQGGASLQFAMLPMNFLTNEKKAAYILSGSWSEKAFQEASRIGETYELASTKADNYRAIPFVPLDQCSQDTSYIHLTSNNTIFGTQWISYPNNKFAPICVDASSDIFSKTLDWGNIDLLYAGAQKNAGPSGVTIVILRKSFMEQANKDIPKILSYETHVKTDSLYHTPPTGSIYLLGLVMNWIEEQGGVAAMEKFAAEKASLLYSAIDNSDGFYKGHALKDSRSTMNVTFNLPSKELEQKFVKIAEEKGFIGLKGHRSVGGLRASIYNAVPKEHVETLVDFMESFLKEHK
ncbi:phosphoserine aminotransferase [Evansella vedderi]|uniref:Phosphoserine aminotransferase n=1 Tax=Evansella vedderi TaxID=38282 RepID=A0ABT9ZSK9_9BACI|nr:3-phosphoserine/phosphohydroxythreonine transaminase [Evansella vedderi]MDQ0254220.1 phosphoserine aminotransferase [Evansella vedderi]